MKTSSGLTDDAPTRTNTSLGPTMTGDLALLVSIRSSMVPYEWTCHAIILDDHLGPITVVWTSATLLTSLLLATAAAVNVRRIGQPTKTDKSFNGNNGNGRRKTNRIAFGLAMFHIRINHTRSAVIVFRLAVISHHRQTLYITVADYLVYHRDRW